MMSRSTWACELKSTSTMPAISMIPVTLHVSVWVEIRYDKKKVPNATVTLHVSVWVEIYQNFIRVINICVTLHVSVWVEIKFKTLGAKRYASRSTWACELKLKNSATQAEPIGHAPRERVSWNVRTWKTPLTQEVTLHVSVWVEMKIFTIFTPAEMVTLHVSVWVEICPFSQCFASASRHAPRERVSWNDTATVNSYNFVVTLHVSVWVEMHI